MNSITQTRTAVIWQVCFGAISALIGLFLTQTGHTQQTKEPPRLALEFRCPDYSLAPGQSMTLRAEVFGAKEVLGEEDAKLISYRWEVSGGKIILGQRTPQVTIEACELPSSSVSFVDVKIKLDGGPPELEKERSCRLKIDPKCAPPFLYDQYEDISLKDEQQRLDRLGRYLTGEDSGAVAYLVAYAGRTSCFREAKLRADRARRYLEANYKLDASRVITVDGGFRDKLTVNIFTSAYDTCGPFPTPSLMSSSANVDGSCADKYKEIVSQ
jgi:hypothetical protein